MPPELPIGQPVLAEAKPRSQSRWRRLALVTFAAIAILAGVGYGISLLLTKPNGTPVVTATPPVAPAVSATERSKVADKPLAASQLDVTDLSAQNGDIGALLVKALQVTGSIKLNGPLTVQGDGTFSGTLAAANFQGNGAGLTGVDAALLNGQPGSFYQNLANSSGQLSSSQLPPNAALRDAANTFTAANTFAAGTTFSGAAAFNAGLTSGTASIGTLSLSTALDVANGGTGLTSVAQQGVLYGQGGGTLAAAVPAGAGLCLVSGATDPTWSVCGGGGAGVASVNGQTGVLTIAGATGAAGTITINDATTAAKGIASFNATNFTAAGGAINTIQNIATTSSPTFAAVTAPTVNANAITPSAALTVGAIAQTLTMQGSAPTVVANSGGFTTTLGFQAPTANVTYRLLATAAGAYDVCTTAGNCVGAGGGVTTAGGTTNRLPKFTGVQTLGDSLVSDNGALVTVGGNLSVTGTASITGSLAANTITSTNAGTTNTLTFAAASGVNKTITIPNATGTLAVSAAGPLALDAAGNLTCATCVTAGGGGGGAAAVDSLNGLTGVLTVANATTAGSTITINDATTAVKGIASFNSTNFTVASGAINTIQNIATTSTPTFAALTAPTVNANTITPSAAFTAGATGQSFTLQGNASSTLTATNGGFTTTLGFQAPTANVTYRFLTAAAGAYDICTTSGNCVGAGGGVTSPGGTTNTLAKFTAGTTIADSIITDNGTTVTIGGILAVNTITPTAALTLGATGQAFKLQGSNTSTITATGGGFTTTLGFTGVPTGAVTYNFDRAATPGAYNVCTTAGNCTGAGGGVTTPGGTANRVAKFTAGGVIGNSSILDNGSNLTLDSGVSIILQGATANITNPQGAAAGEAFGNNATTGDRSVGVGNGAAATSDSVAVGRSAVGADASVAVGARATTASSGSTAIGTDSNSGYLATTVGHAATAGQESVAIGNGATVSDQHSTAIGTGATIGAGHTNSIALGEAATTTAANQLVIGADTRAITQAVIGNGVTNATPIGFALQGTSGIGANIAGAAVTIAGGQGTGSAVGGDVTIQASAAGVSGSGANALATIANFSAGTGIALNQNTVLAAGKNLTVTSGATILTGLAAGSSTALAINTGATTNKGLVVQGAVSQIANLLEVLKSGNATPLASFNANGDLLIGGVATTDSVTALRVIQNGGGNVFVVDANNSRVGIGASAGTPSATLQVAGSLTSAGGAISLTGNAGSSFSTSSGTLSLQGNGGLLLSAGGSNSVTVSSTTSFSNNVTVTGQAADALIVKASSNGSGAVALNVQRNNGLSIARLTDTSLLALGSISGTMVAGTLALADANGNFAQIVAPATLVAPYNFTLPASGGGTFCLDSGNCAASTGRLQNAYDYSQGGAVPEIKLSPLNVGIEIQDANSTIGAGNNFLSLRASNAAGLGNILFGVGIEGNLYMQPSANRTDLIRVTNQTGSNLLTLDSSNTRLGFALGGSTVPNLTGNGIEMKGALKLSGVGSSSNYDQNCATPAGTNLPARLCIASDDGSGGFFSSIAQLGLTVGANSQTTAAVMSLFDARTVAHTPTLRVYSPNESNTAGFSWDGSNTQASLLTDNKATGDSSALNLQSGTSAANGNSGAVLLQSGSIAGGTGQTSGAITIKSGDGAGTNASSGAVTIDSGSHTGGASSGAVTIAGTNASAVTVGNTTSNILTTVYGTALFRPTTGNDSTTAFQIQRAGATALFIADTTNSRLYVGPSAGDTIGALLVFGNKTTSGDPTGTNGGMYYNSSNHTFRCYRDSNWENCGMNPIDRGFNIEDEFMSGNGGAVTNTFLTGIGALGWWQGSPNANASCTSIFNDTLAPAPASSHDHPGTVHFHSGNSNGGCALTIGGDAAGGGQTLLNNLMAAGDIMKSTVAIGSLAATNKGLFRFGWTNKADINSLVAPTSGAWFEYDQTVGGNWRYCYANNAAATCANASAVTAATWTNLEIRVISSTAITFLINGSAAATLTGITYDGGATNKLGPEYVCSEAAASTTRFDCYIDYFQWRGVSSGLR